MTGARVGTLLAARTRWSVPEILFWLVAAGSVVALRDHHLLLTTIAWLGLFALSLDLILGYAGILSLGHAGLFGVGAYAAGLLAKTALVTEPVLALVLSAIAAGVVGFFSALLLVRGSDLTRLMITLGVALILREIANQTPGLTGGADGLQGIAMAPVLGIFPFDIAGHVGYAYALAVLFVLFCIARGLMRGSFGASLVAIRDNALRAEAIGIAVTRRRVAAYTLAAAYAGCAGALMAQTTAFVSLDAFSFERSAHLLLVLIVGGAGYLYGGLIGAIVFTVMQDRFAMLTPQYWPFFVGSVLVLIGLLGRDRVVRWGVLLAAGVRRREVGGAARAGGPRS